MPTRVPRLTQQASWLIGQMFRLRFRIVGHRSLSNLHAAGSGPLILAPNHVHLLDPWLIILAFDFALFRDLTPIRVLATQSWDGPLRRIRWVIRTLYRIYGVVVLPRRER